MGPRVCVCVCIRIGVCSMVWFGLVEGGGWVE